MVRFVISTYFWGAALIRGGLLLEGVTYSDMSINGAEKKIKIRFTLIWVGFLRVRFEMGEGGGGKITSRSKTRQSHARNWKFGTQVQTHM